MKNEKWKVKSKKWKIKSENFHVKLHDWPSNSWMESCANLKGHN